MNWAAIKGAKDLIISLKQFLAKQSFMGLYALKFILPLFSHP